MIHWKRFTENRYVRRGVVMLGIAALSVAGAGALEHAYAIEVGGEVVAYAQNIQEAEAAVASAQRTASDALGYAYDITGVSTILSGTGSETAAGAAELEEKLLEAIPEVVQLYVIYVDGQPLYGVAEQGVAEAALNGMLLADTGGQTVSCGFVQTVQVAQAYVPAELEVSAQALPALLETALEVQRVEQVSERTATAYSTVTIEDDTLYEGESVVETAGADGEEEIIRAYTYVDGELAAEDVVETRVLREAVDEVVRVGTKPCQATGTYIWPTSGLVTSEFGYREGFGSSYHEGIDIASSYGTDIYAADGGVVVMAEWYYGYGNLIVIEHINGETTRYAHLDSMAVSVGDEVGQGQYIGAMGETGVASGVHLHFEVRVDGEAINPREVLD